MIGKKLIDIPAIPVKNISKPILNLKANVNAIRHNLGTNPITKLDVIAHSFIIGRISFYIETN